MSNGNIFVNASGGQGGAGVMYEVDSLNNIIWGPYNAQSQKGSDMSVIIQEYKF